MSTSAKDVELQQVPALSSIDDDDFDLELNLPKSSGSRAPKFQFPKQSRLRTILLPTGIAILTLFAALFLITSIRSSSKAPYLNISHFSKLNPTSIKRTPSSWRRNTNVDYNLTSWQTSDKPKVRKLHWEITNIEAAPDGVVRNMTVINGQFPGPLVQANVGDTLKINVVNNADEPTSIHFHGLFFKNANYYDGAAGINQCEIPAGGKFTYEFKIEQYGTYWYHSHYSTQAADGIVGPVVLHSKEEDSLVRNQYDEDLVVLIADHYHDKADTYLAEYLGPGNENDEPTPDNGLIQGSNTFSWPTPDPTKEDDPVEEYYGDKTYDENESLHHTFILKPDMKYRLRVINVGFFAEIDYTIDEHPLTVIEADGTLTKPIEVDVLSIASAQRYSVIITTDKHQDGKNDLFWMHGKLNPYCFAEGKSWLNIDTRALIIYGDPQNYISHDNRSLSTLQADSTEYQYVRDVFCRELDESLLHPLVPDPAPSNFDQHYRLDAWFNIGAQTLDRAKFNQTSYVPLKNSSTLYKQAFELSTQDASLTQDGPHVPYENNFMINIHEEQTVVDVLINNLDDGSHPFHLHGHKFWIIEVGSGNFHFSDYDSINADTESKAYIKRDTLQVPGYKYAVIRFIADNPGVWPFHCHIGWHMESGLLMQFNVMPAVYQKWKFPKDWKKLCKASH